ncbi:MAG TPA: hypothetical protein VF469_31145 [Kofleriaceae bacterium]
MAETAALIERAGIESYVAVPLVEPSERWFPDEWHPDDGGVARLARRVFEYAGLGDAEIAVDLAGAEDLAGAGESPGVRVTALDARSVRLVADPDHLDDPLGLIAVLARVASAVFRARHELATDDAEHERRCLDVACVYLGFGIIATNAAYRYRASGEQRGYTAITRWSHTQLGALSPQAMAYLLAMQLSARDATSSEIRAVIRLLETNQASYFEAANTEIVPGDLVRELGLPDRATWPARRAPPPETSGGAVQLLRALTARKPEVPTAVASQTSVGGRNAGRAVLRAQYSRAQRGGWLGFAAAFVPVIALGVKGYGGLAFLTMIAAPVLGLLIGRQIRREACSDPYCRRVLAPGIARCPGCGGRIAGTMLRGENRLEAEERLKLNAAEYEMDVGEPKE